jgi:hypothetical protein
MSGSNKEFRFACFMDESFDSLQSPKRNYVISASIFLGEKGGSLNSFDRSTLSFLIRTDSRFRGSQIIFEDDKSDFRFAIADYIAWCTRRAISANDYRFYEFFSESNYLYLHRSE